VIALPPDLFIFAAQLLCTDIFSESPQNSANKTAFFIVIRHRKNVQDCVIIRIGGTFVNKKNIFDIGLGRSGGGIKEDYIEVLLQELTSKELSLKALKNK